MENQVSGVKPSLYRSIYNILQELEFKKLSQVSLVFDSEPSLMIVCRKGNDCILPFSDIR